MAQHRVNSRVDLNAVMPLEVMLDNMRWAHPSAQKLVKPGHTDVQGLKELLKLRSIAQACAAEAAPYLHPRLAAAADLKLPQDEGPRSPEDLLEMILEEIDGRTRGLTSRSH